MPRPIFPALMVSRKALDRYRELVANLSDREIFTALSGPTFELAAEIGAPFVKLGSGHRAVIREGTVVTILHADCSCGLLDPRRDPTLQQEQPQ